MHTHVKRIIPSIALEVLLVVAFVVALIYIPEKWRKWAIPAALLLFVILTVFALVIPWLRWVTTTYTITNRRIITRYGILNKKGHDIPLKRIANVAYDHSLLDRVFGCGTLILQTSADDPLLLDDIPKVEQIHTRMTEVLFSSPLEHD